MGTYPSPLPSQKTPEPPYEHGQVPHGLSRSIPGLINNASINDPPTQQCPHHGIIRTLLWTTKWFENTIHHQCLVPELVIECRPSHLMVIPIVMHHHQVYPLQGHLSDLSNQIWTRPYLLIQWVVLSITSVEMEMGVFLRDLVSHGIFKGTTVDQRHCEWKR